MKLTINKKLFVFTIIPFVILYTSIMALNITTMRQWAIDNAEKQMTELAQNYVYRFESLLKETAQVAVMTAAYIEITPKLSSDQLYILLQSNLEHNSLVYGSAVVFEPYKYEINKRLFVRYVHRDGKAFEWVDPSETGYDYTDSKQEYWHMPRNTGKAIWTDPYFDEGGGNILMSTYSVPFFIKSNFLGVATVDIPLEPLRELSEINIPDDIKFSIITKTGKFVYSSQLERINKPVVEIWDQQNHSDLITFANKVSSGKAGNIKLKNWDSEETDWIFYTPIKSAQWGFAASIPTDIVLRPIQKQFYRNVSFFICSLIFILVCLWGLSRKISRPIMSLNKAVEEFSKGNLRVHASVDSNDEFGVLAETLNKMALKISDRETQLLESEERYRAIAEDIPVLICRFLPDGEILYVNEAYCNYFSKKIEDLVGHSFLDLIPKDDCKSVMKSISSLTMDAPTQTHEHRVIMPNGDINWHRWTNRGLFDDNGQLTAYQAIGEDITDRKLAENKQKDSESKYRHLYETMTQGVVIEDSEGKIIEANKSACNILGLSLEQLLGKTAYNPRWKLVHENGSPYDPSEVPSNIALRTGKPVENELCGIYVPEGDKYRWIVIGSTPKFKEGEMEPFITMTVFSDITKLRQTEQARRLLEDRLRQSEKMQAVGTMAGGIAHEFNNLLGVIMGCADMARDEVPRDSFAKKQLDSVMIASCRVKNLVKQILTFSRQAQQEKIPANLCPLVKESVKLIESSIPSSVEVREKNIDPACDNALVDPTEIQQIIMNLSSNAVWAMKEKGTIEISLQQIQLDEKKASAKGIPPGNYIELTFSDTGQGMDEETRARIFDPFFTQKEVGGGTGMGLSIVYGIMESYGGTITVKSEAGKGTTFCLYFPVTVDPFVEKPEIVEEVPKGTEKILFVDDEEIYADMCKEMVSRLGYDVDLKTNSSEALSAFKAAPEDYDLVITDQIMPHLSGEELVHEIRAIKPNMPIILCTGYSTQMDDKKAESLGINAFAYKPISKKDIAKMIRKVLDEK